MPRPPRGGDARAYAGMAGQGDMLGRTLGGAIALSGADPRGGRPVSSCGGAMPAGAGAMAVCSGPKTKSSRGWSSGARSSSATVGIGRSKGCGCSSRRRLSRTPMARTPPMGWSAPPVNDSPGTSSDTDLWRRDLEHGLGGVAPLRWRARGIPPDLSVAPLRSGLEDARGCRWYTPSGATSRVVTAAMLGCRVASGCRLSSGTSIMPVIYRLRLML